MMRRPHNSVAALVRDIRGAMDFREAWHTPASIDCRVSANVGELMDVALMAVGLRPKVQGGAYPCETDYLAARGAVFPAVPAERLEAFNRETLHDRMTEDDEMKRYSMIAAFFKEEA